MHIIDYVVIISFFIIIILITLYYTRKAGSDTSQFFLSGRNLPWYLAGTAMVATTFAADTPLAVTELVAKNGIAGNWLWWNMAIGGLLTVFFFAKLWRRAGILTDLEFIELRYSGKPAAWLRGFKAIYLGLFMNIIILGWVHKAMEKIFSVMFPEANAILLVGLLGVGTAFYALSAGLLGSARTDSFQFIFALIGCVILAVIVVRVPELGSTEILKEKLHPETLKFIPSIGSQQTNPVTGILFLTFGAFIAYAFVQWWASWYPGADPGGGGYIAQRMMSAKDEKHSLLGTLWFNIAHYTLRPWPWIVVALAALVILPRSGSLEELEKENAALFAKIEAIYPDNSKELLNTEELAFYEKYENTIDPGIMYPKLMLKYLPSGLLGLLLAVFMAAYMSTIASQLNWGTSYLMNDFYRRFINKSKSDKHYVNISRVTIFLLLLLSLLISFTVLQSISGAWEFIINASAGIGAVLILRWYWWRINAWSEITAMLAPLLIYPFVKYVFHIEPPMSLFPVAFGSTIIWLIATYISKPEPIDTLSKFYQKVQPDGPGWKIFHTLDKSNKQALWLNFFNWILAIIAVYASLYGIGQLIFKEFTEGFIAICISILAFIGVGLILQKND